MGPAPCCSSRRSSRLKPDGQGSTPSDDPQRPHCAIFPTLGGDEPVLLDLDRMGP
jgi:hypothetical protein